MTSIPHLGPLWASPNGGGHFTREEDLYFQHLQEVKYNLSGAHVLEIGPGDGMFARRLLRENKLASYTLLDVKEHLSNALNAIHSEHPDTPLKGFSSEEFETVMTMEFDLVVSNICIPETPREYHHHLLSNLLPRAQSAMIIGQITEMGINYETWLKGLFVNSFDRQSCILTSYKNCYAWTGYNIKK